MTYVVEWIASPVVLGGMLVLIGPFALIVVIVVAFAVLAALVAVAFAVLAALVALVGAGLALPYLLVRSVHRRLAGRRLATEANKTIGFRFSSIEGVEQ